MRNAGLQASVVAPHPVPPSELASASSLLKVTASASGCGGRGNAVSTGAAERPLPGELQTIRAGIVNSLTEWKNRCGSGLADDTALVLVKATITHFAARLAEVDKAIAGTIDNDPDLSAKRDLLLSISGVGEVLAGLVVCELPGTDVLRSSAQAVAYVGLNPRSHRSGSSIDRPTRISKIGNATLRSALYMPALSAMQHNPVVAALAKRLRAQGRLKGKQIAVAAMRKLLVLCFGVLKSGKPFDPALAMPN